MLKKKLIKISIIFIITLSTSVLILGKYFIYKLENYEKLTFDTVLKTENSHYSEHYGIGAAKDPSDYSFDNFQVHEFKSQPDKIKLHAWFVPSINKQSKKAILFLHGHHANKLRTMKYLALVKAKNLNMQYSCFFPDLRNSGMSEDAKTSMGSEFAEDITSSILYLNEKFSINNIVIYGFSMGAMGTLVLLDKKELYGALNKKGIKINRIIFDSPMSNLEKMIIHETVNAKNLPYSIAKIGTTAFRIRTNGYMDKMRLSTIYKELTIPLLILQARNDPKTRVDILESELKLLDNKNIHVKFFPTGEHVKLFQNSKIRDEYMNTVADFINGNVLQ